MNKVNEKHREVLLELLKELDRVCKKHEIKYQLFCGSALGAVRHKGFIPWDDDLDVAMLRSEYQRFLEIAPSELGEQYFLQAELSPNWSMFFSKLRKNWTGMDLHKRAKCGIICISGIEKGYHNGKGQVQRRNEVANRQVRA